MKKNSKTNNNKNRNNKTVLLTMISFFAVILLVAVMNSDVTFAVEEGVYYADDLKVGDILPVGSKIITNIDYHDASGRYANYVYLRFIPSPEDKENYYESRNYTHIGGDFLSCCYFNGIFYYEPGITTGAECVDKYGTGSHQRYSYFSSFETCRSGQAFYDDKIENYTCDLEKVISNEQYTVLDYKTYFGDTDLKFTGWQIVNTESNIIYLSPINDSYMINKTPSSSNDWTIDTTFANQNGSINKWYKYSLIDKYELYQTNTNIDNLWQISNGVYKILDENTGNINDKYGITFTFEAEKDEIVYFDLKYYGYYDSYETDYNPSDPHCSSGNCSQNVVKTYFYLDDEIINGITPTDFYKTNYLKITKSGTHTLKILYKVPSGYTSSKKGYLNYIYVKDLMVLTPLNYEKVLNEELVLEGDNLFYESIDNNGLKLSQRIVYDKKAEDNIQDDNDDSITNPSDKENDDDTTNDSNQNNNQSDKDNNKDFVNPETASNILIIVIVLSIVAVTVYTTYNLQKEEKVTKSTKKKNKK